ncbi:GPW/gp25 family protein [Nonlabens sp.]|uniref:GPW/gp25 family protein n=1 Tax=Nonlabens sp. TaxID=1888209 RepID=UPI0025EB7159|nr:GPW/gp25 family protein [Nonlabens sp.]
MVKTPFSKKQSLYADFKKNLAISPISKDLALIKDDEAVKQSIKNLVLTDPGERLMQPFIGGGIRALLFENITPAVLNLIENKVKSTIKTYEPRADIINVTASSKYDDNTVNVVVNFYIRNTNEPIKLDLILTRVR